MCSFVTPDSSAGRASCAVCVLLATLMYVSSHSSLLVSRCSRLHFGCTVPFGPAFKPSTIDLTELLSRLLPDDAFPLQVQERSQNFAGIQPTALHQFLTRLPACGVEELVSIWLCWGYHVRGQPIGLPRPNRLGGRESRSERGGPLFPSPPGRLSPVLLPTGSTGLAESSLPASQFPIANTTRNKQVSKGRRASGRRGSEARLFLCSPCSSAQLPARGLAFGARRLVVFASEVEQVKQVADCR
jgi:hypothetical protein